MAANRIYIQVDFQQQNAVAGVNQLNQSLASIGPAAQQSSQQATKAISGMSLSIRQTENSLNNLAGAVASLGMLKAADDILKTTGEIDTLRKTLVTATGDIGLSMVQFQKFIQMSQKSGVSLEPAIQAFTRLRGAAVSIGESERMIEGFGRALGQMGMGGPALMGVIEQVVQSISKGGGIMREDLKFIQQYVPQVTQILQKLYKTSNTEALQKMPGLTAAKVWREVTTELLKLQEVTPGVQKMMEQFWQQNRLGVEALGQSLAQVLKPQMDALSEKIKELIQWWQRLSPEMRGFIVRAGEVVTALGLIAGGIGSIILMVNALSAALASNPATAVLLGLSGAIAVAAATGGLKPATQGAGVFPKGFEMPKAPPLPGPGGPPKGWEATGPTGKDIAAAKELSNEAKSAAESMAKWNEDIRQTGATGLADAIADLTKQRAETLTGEQKFQAELAALLMQREKLWKDRITRTGKGGVPQTATETAEAAETYAHETLVRTNQLRLKTVQDVIEANKKMLKEHVDAVEKAEQQARDIRVAYWTDTNNQLLEGARQLEQQKLQIQLQSLDYQRDAALEALGTLDDRTLKQKLALADQRLAIEQKYVDEALKLNLQLLQLDRERAIAQADMQAAVAKQSGSPEHLKVIESINAIYDKRKEGMESGASQKREMERLKTISDKSRMVRDEMTKTFERFRDLADGVFDALLDKSKSVWQAMADFWKTTILSMMKQIFSTTIARTMMRVFGYGDPGAGAGGGGLGGLWSGSGSGVGRTPPFFPSSTGSSGGGWRSILGGLFGGGGRGGGGFDPSNIPGGGVMWGRDPYSGGSGAPLSTRSGGLFGLGGLYDISGIPGGKSGGTPMWGSKIGGGFKSGMMNDLFTMGGLSMAMAGFNQKGVMGNVNRTAGAGMAAYGIAGKQLGILGSAGVGLAYNGLVQGGWKGMAQTTAGGAMIGFQFGGPLGALIGAGIGATAGLIRMMFKGAAEKTRAKVKEVYGVDISSQGILKQITEIIKQSYGGDLSVGVYSPQVRELVQLYAMSTGQSVGGGGRPMYGVSFAMQGGNASLQAVYSNGNVVANPYTGTTTTQLNSFANPSVFVQLNPQQANALFEGRVVEVIDSNPSSVADSNSAVMDGSTARRNVSQNALMEPMTLMS